MFNYSSCVVVTNRHLCNDDYMTQIQKVVALHPHSLILREKDLSLSDYESLAEQVLLICAKYDVPCFLHTHAEIALKLHCERIHFSTQQIKENFDLLPRFREISVSAHSKSDVTEATSLGATQIVLGNIFETDCKQGLPGKGLEFLHEICTESSLSVYGIGGINFENLDYVLNAGAAGGCMMSGFMNLK